MSKKLTNVLVAANAGPVPLPASALAGRIGIRIKNPSASGVTCYVGTDPNLKAGAAVAGDSQGEELFPGTSLPFDTSPSETWFARTTADLTLQVWETN